MFPGVNALKYSLDGATRICNQLGDVFEAPEDGWGTRVYTANMPVVAAAPRPRPPTTQAPVRMSQQHMAGLQQHMLFQQQQHQQQQHQQNLQWANQSFMAAAFQRQQQQQQPHQAAYIGPR